VRRLAIALLLAAAACSGPTEEAATPETTLPVIETTVPTETTKPALSAADRRQCEKFSRGLERAEKRLAKLKHDGPPPPVDGYDFTEDYNRDLFETEQEVEFYIGAISSPPCVPDEGYPSDESGYVP
jgi:hypothetical protein